MKPSDDISITPEHKYPINLPPNHQLTLTMRAKSYNVGVLCSLLAIRCSSIHTKSITILRRWEICVDTTSDSDQPSMSLVSAFQPRDRPDFFPAREIVKADRPSWAKTEFPCPAGQYKIPEALRDLLHRKPAPGIIEASHLVREMAGGLATLRHSSSVYADRTSNDLKTAPTLAGHLQKVGCCMWG